MGLLRSPLIGLRYNSKGLYVHRAALLLLRVFISQRLFTAILLFLYQIINMEQPDQPNSLNIEISEEIAEGTYANLAIITHSHAEFVVDFVNVMPGTPKSKVKSRIILTPQHAKRLMKALTENIQKYESLNGAIKDIEEIQLPMSFGGPTAQA